MALVAGKQYKKQTDEPVAPRKKSDRKSGPSAVGTLENDDFDAIENSAIWDFDATSCRFRRIRW